MTNLAHKFAAAHLKSVERLRAEWDGFCVDLAGEVLEAYDTKGDGTIAWLELPEHPDWKYHAAAVINGMVHDLWLGDVELTPAEWARAWGKKPHDVEYPAREESEREKLEKV